MNKIELLAPAASFEGMKAAINAGADAVYMGGRSFGARAYATNFDEECLIEAIRYAHIHNVKVHLTVNTLLKEDEINNELYNYIKPYYIAGLDAVIVQDLGVMKFIRTYFPDIEIHMSTQTTITSSNCLNIVKNYDIERIVLARELNIDEIAQIKKETNVEVETFVHGALCYSYSGQCLLSSMIGDRSGNRGRCAQPCRKMYQLFKGKEKLGKEAYLLSPKDMCGLGVLHNLIQIGVNSLKIEGRMKKPEYAALIVSIYRKYIDLFYDLGYEEYINYIDTHEEELKEDISKMQDIYSRGGFTSGYFNRHNGSDMMSVHLPSHQGVLVGSIVNVDTRYCSIRLSKNINKQDVLFIRDERNVDELSSYEFTIKDAHPKGDVIKTNYSKGVKLYQGQKVYRVKNNSLIDYINDRYISINKKVVISINILMKKDRNICVEVLLNNEIFRYEFDKPSKAINRPITKENVVKQFKKILDTPYMLKEISIDMDDDLFVPIKELNEIRRYVIDRLMIDYNDRIVAKRKRRLITFEKKDIDNIYIKSGKKSQKDNIKSSVRLSVLVQNIDQLSEVTKFAKVDDVYLELDAFNMDDLTRAIEQIKQVGMNVYIAMPRIIRSKHYTKFINSKNNILSSNMIAGFLVRNVEAINIIKEITKENVCIISDYNMYVTNNYSKRELEKLGIDITTVSQELSKEELKDIDKNNIQIVVYSRPVVMVSANCVKKTNGLCDKLSKWYELKDGYGQFYKVRTVCDYCYNIIYNSKIINIYNDIKREECTNNFNHIRIEFTNESCDEIKQVMNNLILNNNNSEEVYKGHYNRKTL